MSAGGAVVPLAEMVQLKGELRQGSLVFGKVAPASQVSLNGRPLPLSADGDFVFGLDRDAVSGDVLEIRHASGLLQTRVLEVAARQYAIQQVNGVPADIQSMQKSEATWLRIRDEVAAAQAARQIVSQLSACRQDFVWPLIGPVTGVFGSQRVYNGAPGTPHYGVDIAAPTGTPVQAPADGVVTLADDDMYYSGGTLIIDHGFGVSSSFIHLSKILVKVGAVVRQGDDIALVGATGRASGPHLDWRMNWLDRRIDPQLLVPAMPGQ